MFLRTRCAKLKMRELIIHGCPYGGGMGAVLTSAENLLNPLYLQQSPPNRPPPPPHPSIHTTG